MFLFCNKSEIVLANIQVDLILKNQTKEEVLVYLRAINNYSFKNSFFITNSNLIY